MTGSPYRWMGYCAALWLGCASGTDFERGNPAPPSRVIGHDEIVEARSASNAFQLVSLLRPDWLRPRGESLSNPTIMPVVYVDNMRYGPIESLNEIRVGVVDEVRYYSPSAATTKWGTGVMGGAIEIVRFPQADAADMPLARTEVGLDGAFRMSDCLEAFRKAFPDRAVRDPPVLSSDLGTGVPKRLDGPELAYPESEVFAGRLSGWANLAFVVEVDGRVADGALISASQEAFAVEASVWITESTWTPGTLGGSAVPTLMCERVSFRVGG